MDYLHWNEKTITDFSDKNICEMYEKGYVFTRIKKGVMHQTRSLRIDLKQFELSSENRRILKKTADILLKTNTIPFFDYNYSIGKLAKDFYEDKFGSGIMSAQKIKEMLTDREKSNFNTLLTYFKNITSEQIENIGYTICFANTKIFHYSYPFYDVKRSSNDMGMGMMLKAILYAHESKIDYIYLGSLQRPNDIYKLQFSGLEWFDENKWSTDLDKAKSILIKK